MVEILIPNFFLSMSLFFNYNDHMNHKMNTGTLYLIPCTLGETQIDAVIPFYVQQVLNNIDEYIVEDVRSARRYLKKVGIIKSLDDIIFHCLNKHSKAEEVSYYLSNIAFGKNIGIISEAGCPGIADPGAEIVKIAHQNNIKVVPLVGPSSILLALMASGLNGQVFQFHGYLPKDRNERIKKIKELEKAAIQKSETQIFIETPFRNLHLFEDIINTCHSSLLLCIGCDITLPGEFIKTKSILEWKNKLPEINKRPAIFLINK